MKAKRLAACPLASNIAAISFIGRRVDSTRHVLISGLRLSMCGQGVQPVDADRPLGPHDRRPDLHWRGHLLLPGVHLRDLVFRTSECAVVRISGVAVARLKGERRHD